MRSLTHLCVLLLFGVSICPAQESPAHDSEHETLAGFDWLRQFEGNWATAQQGTMRSNVVGEIWIVSELSFQSRMSAVQTIGYDAKKKQFTGSWIDSTSSYIWQYTGSLDAAGNRLSLETEGPDLSDPTKNRRYRDNYEFVSEDEILAVSEMLNDAGEWQTFSTSKMTRSAP